MKIFLLIFSVILIVIIVIYVNIGGVDNIKRGERASEITDERMFSIIENMEDHCFLDEITPENCEKIADLFYDCVYKWLDRMPPDICESAINKYLICSSKEEGNCENKYFYPFEGPDGFLYAE